MLESRGSVAARYQHPWGFSATFATLLLLSACGGQNYAPVRELQKPSKVTSGFHGVQKGESLYSIAWRYGWDYRVLAVANGIRSPYIIYPGQKIKLSAKSSPTAIGKVAPVKSKRHPASQQQSVITTRLKWRWPTQGQLMGRFSGAQVGNKGIDIKGRAGDPVRAAAGGRVVYAGNGLTGYGNLLIVKHNDTYLSAYAHNKVLFKKEQEKVKAGEIIAEIGSTGAKSSRLHFEIRKNGKPVDPLRYLPGKK